jgi:hypothetical protein
MATSRQQGVAPDYAWGSSAQPESGSGARRLSSVVLAELALVLGLFVAYELVRWLAIDDVSTAFANARRIVEWERSAGIFIEHSVQSSLMQVDQLSHFLAAYYVWALYPLMIALAVLTFVMNRDLYRWARRAIFLSWGIALAGYMFFPVAPPRFLWEQGFVDVVHGESSGLPFWVNSYAAMPSMHEGFAIIFGITLYRLLTPWLGFSVALALPALMFFSIVGTANHFVLDAVAGTAVAVLGMVTASLMPRLMERLARRRRHFRERTTVS